MRNTAFLVSLLAMLCISTLAQQNASSIAAKDLFLGKWKLNVDKSSPGPAAETITIEPDGKKYRITLEISHPDGFKHTAWTVSDMKGWSSPVERNPVLLPATEWHVKREAADSFTIVAVPDVAGSGRAESRYTVGPDRKTLTKRVISGGAPDHRHQILVFEKVP
jgi:hypothetical protein